MSYGNLNSKVIRGWMCYVNLNSNAWCETNVSHSFYKSSVYTYYEKSKTKIHKQMKIPLKKLHKILILFLFLYPYIDIKKK